MFFLLAPSRAMMFVMLTRPLRESVLGLMLRTQLQAMYYAEIYLLFMARFRLIELRFPPVASTVYDLENSFHLPGSALDTDLSASPGTASRDRKGSQEPIMGPARL